MGRGAAQPHEQLCEHFADARPRHRYCGARGGDSLEVSFTGQRVPVGASHCRGVIGAASGMGLWAPVQLIAIVWYGPAAMMHLQAGGVFAGLMTHMMMGAMLGIGLAVLFRVVPQMAASGARLRWGAGYGLVLWLVSHFMALPLVDPMMPSHKAPWAFALGHMMFGPVAAAFLVGAAASHAARTTQTLASSKPSGSTRPSAFLRRSRRPIASSPLRSLLPCPDHPGRLTLAGDGRQQLGPRRAVVGGLAVRGQAEPTCGVHQKSPPSCRRSSPRADQAARIPHLPATT